MQLKKRIQDSKKLEKEIIQLRKGFDEESIKSKFENSSRSLYEILSVQRPSSNKTGLGYDKEKKLEYSSFTNQDGNKRSYVAALKSPIKREESKKLGPLLQITYMMSRKSMTSKHHKLFLGNCYTCNNFGHIARNCKLKAPVEKGITSHTYSYKENITRNNPKG